MKKIFIIALLCSVILVIGGLINMDHEKVYVYCENMCKEEGLTKVQIEDLVNNSVGDVVEQVDTKFGVITETLFDQEKLIGKLNGEDLYEITLEINYRSNIPSVPSSFEFSLWKPGLVVDKLFIKNFMITYVNGTDKYWISSTDNDFKIRFDRYEGQPSVSIELVTNIQSMVGTKPSGFITLQYTKATS